ncbi:hypothetical protein Y032_0151g2827 [Ancylostoma ceylanicum]|uniref:Secreted protein n=1 Tax=Ancylostoma ceylanicum TaxID=53326 RepID=A0A016T0Z1_9BILA|nr:hypothetical protein Y032_0151g2827 [Ancylostoma ceylanicum]
MHLVNCIAIYLELLRMASACVATVSPEETTRNSKRPCTKGGVALEFLLLAETDNQSQLAEPSVSAQGNLAAVASIA